MSTARSKILKKNKALPSQLDLTIAQCLLDIQEGHSSIRAFISPLQICGVRQIDVEGKKKALVIFIPYPQLNAYHKIQTQLISELEKKLSGKHVFIVAKRRIIAKPKRGHKYTQPRPRSRTLLAVQEKMLEDIVYPAEIVGKRIKYRLDGTKVARVILGQKEKESVDAKIKSLQVVYRQLTGKDATFDFNQ
jgi:small subunit ribosomal protein S7e